MRDKKLVPQSDLDYVVLYAEALKKNSSLFEQQKMLIESQMKGSRELFKNRFGKNFKKEARKYLKQIKLIN